MYISSHLFQAYFINLQTMCFHTEKSLKIKSIHLANKEVYFIFTTCYMTSDFPQKAIYLTILSFTVQIIHAYS
jgi:hypothetical protein